MKDTEKNKMGETPALGKTVFIATFQAGGDHTIRSGSAACRLRSTRGFFLSHKEEAGGGLESLNFYKPGTVELFVPNSLRF